MQLLFFIRCAFLAFHWIEFSDHFNRISRTCLYRQHKPSTIRHSLSPQGPSIYDSTKKSGFWPPPPVHMRPHEPGSPSPSLWTSTCGRHENTHRSLETAIVQCPSGPKAEIRLYDCNVF